jgi:hypothetical protein
MYIGIYVLSKGQVYRIRNQNHWEMIRGAIALAPSRVNQSQLAGGANEANAPPQTRVLEMLGTGSYSTFGWPIRLALYWLYCIV